MKFDAIGTSKDYGLMQITPIAARDINVIHNELLNPFKNVEAGIKLLSKLKKRLKDMNKVLIAYNAGVGKALHANVEYINNHKYIKAVYKFL